MASRFERLYELPNNLYSLHSPIIITAGALLKDNETGSILAQLKFCNITEKPIIALKISLGAFDVTGAAVQGVEEYQYLDLNVPPDDYFGSNKAIVFPQSVTRSFAITNITVYFEDGTIQKTALPLVSLPEGKELSDSLQNPEWIKQCRLEINKDAKYNPCDCLDLWFCTCGRWNRRLKCVDCGADKSVAFSALELPQIKEKTECRLEKEQAAEEERRLTLAKKQAQKKRNIKRAIIVLIICCILGAAGIACSQWLYPDVIKPSMNYAKACQLLENGEYDEAIDGFLALGDYKDAATMKLEAQYQKAIELYQNKQFDESITLLKRLKDYSDSFQKIAEIQYAKAMHLKEEGDLDGAAKLLRTLGEYGDSETQIQEIEFVYAQELLSMGKYAEARERLLILGEYENAVELVKECNYLEAQTLFANEEYSAAVELFQSLSGYKDSDNMATNSKYHNALLLMEKSRFSDAIVLLEELGEYENAADYLTECKYQLAIQFINRRDYENAKVLLLDVGQYKEAAEYLLLIPKTQELVYCWDGDFSYCYLLVRTVIDTTKCTTKTYAWEARSTDRVGGNSMKYVIDYVQKFEEWKYENGKLLMVFLGSNPMEDRKAYREWSISGDWNSILSRSMLYTGEEIWESGDHDEKWSLVDADTAQKVIQGIENYR